MVDVGLESWRCLSSQDQCRDRRAVLMEFNLGVGE